MPHPLPQRADHRPTRFLAVLWVVLAASSFSPFWSAPQKELKQMPGQVPKRPPYVSGFPIPFHRMVDYRPLQGSVVAADLEKTGHPDLVVSLTTGMITVVRADGSTPPGWPRLFDQLPQPAYPYGDAAVGDLDGDGSSEIVTCVVSGNVPRRNFLYAFRADGSDLPGWPVEMKAPGQGYYSCSAAGVLLADLNGDGRKDVVRGMNLDEVQAFDGSGRPLPGWPVRLPPDAAGRVRGINADLAAADLDGDGRQEVIFVESGFEPRLVAVAPDGHPMPGFPRVLSSIVDQQAPCAADLDGDGRPELIQATLPYSGAFLASGAKQKLVAGAAPPLVPASLNVLRADGSSPPGWPRNLNSGGPWGSLLADIDGDGLPEILQQDGDLLYAYNSGDVVLPGFPLTVHRQPLRADAMQFSPWVASDLDGDGRVDLLQGRSVLYAGSVWLRLFGIRTNGQSLRGFPFDLPGMMAASKPVLVDLSNDGVVDLVMLTSDATHAGYFLMAFDLGALARGPVY